MAVHKRKLHGKLVWRYKFDAPGSTRDNRVIIERSGFATKDEATKAEAARRLEEQQKFELAKAGSGVAGAPPKTLGMLLHEFIKQHAEEKLSPTTVQGYRNKLKLLDPQLLAMPIPDITALHLSREWTRLLKAGGLDRKTKARRPLGRKTVREVAGMVSAALNRGIIWGVATTNPVRASEPPVPKKHRAVALTVAQQDLLIESARGPWCIRALLKVSAALGVRRGEVLALRWSDIHDSYATIERSLIQTRKGGLQFKGTKTDNPRVLVIPTEAREALESHRKQQNELRCQFGPTYQRDLDLVFCKPDGSPIKPDSLSGTIGELFGRLGIPKPKGSSLHLLRHTHASHLLASGTPVPAVSARLGHTSIRTTLDIYGHMIHGQDEEAVRKWEQYQRENRATCQTTKTVQ